MLSDETIQQKERIFNSIDFQKFLNNSKQNEGVFASKSDSASFPNFETLDSVNSREFYSNIYSSSDFWQSMKDLQQSQSEYETEKKSFTKDSSDAEHATTIPLARHISKDDRLRSKEWMDMKNLGNHVDVSYDQEMFSDFSSEEKSHKGVPSSTVGTNWEKLFYHQLQYNPPALEKYKQPKTATVTRHTTTTTTTKKRVRKPRSKLEPSVKKYVVPTDLDILSGRGGKSNHHPGNKRYREEIENFRAAYANLSDKDDKTDMSRMVVDYVHKYGGRFLEIDRSTRSWYIITDAKARRKVSQALREDGDPVKRAAKRARFLKKKRAMLNKSA